MLRVQQAQQEQLVRQELQVPQVLRVQQAQQEQLVRQEPQEPQAQKQLSLYIRPLSTGLGIKLRSA